MSQIESNFDPNSFVPRSFTPGSAMTPVDEKYSEAPPPQPELSDKEKEEMEEIIRTVRERQAKNPNPKWLSTQDILRFIEEFDGAKETA